MIVLHGENNHVIPREVSQKHARFFAGPYERRVIPGVGHNVPQHVLSIVAGARTDRRHFFERGAETMRAVISSRAWGAVDDLTLEDIAPPMPGRC